ncbi:class II aaRS and biotin synthetase [Piedraia hortae CBS 480.64]|uniref:Class II aaRS and biotin synthetase n=1 Tax=Piedraia hortae CBS 480.64 TaxID=1314780 RepID=A0A6A7C8L7_9PEZI|nr:class II aaRS and biotin synthetase [Piedraia hortae CBS 480.64]
MSTKVNVLVYSGQGTTLYSVRYAIDSLRSLLGPNYAVLPVTAQQIINEPWASSCALLVIPGGADLGYCRELNGVGNRRIKQYVDLGGRYLGFCAGGYYGCGRCEFEEGRALEVVGDRELAFFPGTCRGLAFPGFIYHSEAGTRASELAVNRRALPNAPDQFRTYYNGGGVFVDAADFPGTEVLASYVSEPVVESKGRAAVVYCRVGDGAAILTGPHPEFAGENLDPDDPSGPPDYPESVAALKADDQKRINFMKACLSKLGLTVSKGTNQTPNLSPLYLSSSAGDVSQMIQNLRAAGVVTTEDGREVIRGENDTFVLQPYTAPTNTESQHTNDHGNITKHLIPCVDLPTAKTTPYFNHTTFFTHLSQTRQSTKWDHPSDCHSPTPFGRTLLYGEVVTSTTTLLEKNPTLLSHLPVGLVAVATTQLAGRGRGSNIWVSPQGSLMFTLLLRHKRTLSQTAPVALIQYIAALAIISGIKTYSKEYSTLPVKIKWPNDIHARVGKGYVKIGGILVTSTYDPSKGDFTLLVGVGINVHNRKPTVSLAQVVEEKGDLPAPQMERLLAGVLTEFERLYARFQRTGFDKLFERDFYDAWLHEGQVVVLEGEGGVKARIKGITTDWGLLVAEELETGRRVELQSDANSFDFWKGLVRRKG